MSKFIWWWKNYSYRKLCKKKLKKILLNLKELLLKKDLTAKEINVDENLLKNALLYAKDYRERYTVFKTANELGMLEDIVGELV